MTQIRISRGAAFSLLVSILFSFLAAGSALTPLWAHYETEWNLSPISVTIAFGVYAVALMAALLTVGSLSDHVGRRPVIIAALLVDAVAMAVFASAGGLGALLVGRILQGFATGAALGAVGAAVIDIDKERGTRANGYAGLGGFALGALGSSLLVAYAPAPTRAVYLLLLVIFLIQSLGVALMAETTTSRPGALASLRPNVTLPRSARGPFLLTVPILVATWGLSGFFASLGPALIRLVAGSNSIVVGSLAVTAFSGVAALAVVFTRKFAPDDLMLGGSVAVLLGVTATLLGIIEASTILYFVGAAVAGGGFGASFQGAIRTVLPCAEARDRAGLLSAIYIVSYLGLSVPAVIAAVIINGGATVVHTSEGFAGIVIAVSALPLAALVARRPKPREQFAGGDEVMARAGCLEA